jgi:nitrate/TMAO reductase-like tetraheme cytochrome c subunit
MLSRSRRYLQDLRAQPWLLGVILLGLLAGGFAGAPVGQAGFEYTWKDANFCDNCHVHDYANEAWFASIHADLTTCHDCHRVPMRHYPKNLYLMAFDRPQTHDDIHTPDVHSVICEQCHNSENTEELTGPMPESVRRQLPKVDTSPLHAAHLSAEEEISCLDCHGSLEDGRPHTFASANEHCLDCHEDQSTHNGDLLCRDCHFSGFLTE